MEKSKSGISLIVLVITILVLGILAATVIVSISNTNVVEEANKTVFKSDLKSYKEAFELYVTSETMKNNSFNSSSLDGTYKDNEDTFNKIFGKVEEKYQDGIKIQDGKLVYETEDETEKEIAKDLGMLSSTNDTTKIVIGKETVIVDGEEKSKYIGYYADADGDGTVDSIIFADLAHDASGTWNPAESTDTYATTGGAWKYEAKANLKNYVVSQESYTDKFGTAPVLKAVGSGEDRFYCMALSDITSEEAPNNAFAWYDAAFNNGNGISDYADITKVGFGEGKKNTARMISKWNGSEDTSEGVGDYGAQNAATHGYLDVWGAIQDEVAKGWFLPSSAEWAAFGGAFGIATSNYSDTYGLDLFYLSSSLAFRLGAYSARYDRGYMYPLGLQAGARVRLATTF